MILITIAITTSDAAAASTRNFRSLSVNEPMRGSTPIDLSFSALSGERTRAVILNDAASGWVSKRPTTFPPIKPDRYVRVIVAAVGMSTYQ